MNLTIAARLSPLGRAQTAYIIQLLQAAWPALECREQIVPAEGDQGKAGDLEAALLSREVDVVVRSLKDLPLEAATGLAIAAIPARDSAFDVLLSARGQSLLNLPGAARVGTSSPRRRAQLLACRSDLTVVPLGGSLETRVRKLLNREYDALILASAGLSRIGLQAHVTETLPLEVMLPAPGQGALAVQCRAQDTETLGLLTAIHDPHTASVVTAERAFLAALGGGCSLPVGAFAQTQNGQIILTGGVISPDGKRAIRLSAADQEPRELGERLARFVLERGGADLLH